MIDHWWDKFFKVKRSSNTDYTDNFTVLCLIFTLYRPCSSTHYPLIYEIDGLLKSYVAETN